MPIDDYRIAFELSDFESLRGPIDFALLTTALIALPLESPILDIRPLPRGGASIEWQSLVSPEDRDRVRAAIARFTTGPVSSEPFSSRIAVPVVAATNEPVTVLELTSGPLAAGFYLVTWSSNFRLTAPASSTSALAEARVGVANPNTDHDVQTDFWPHALPHAFNGTSRVAVRTGERIRALLTLAKTGPGAVSAEMTRAEWHGSKLP